MFTIKGPSFEFFGRRTCKKENLYPFACLLLASGRQRLKGALECFGRFHVSVNGWRDGPLRREGEGTEGVGPAALLRRCM